MPRDSAAARAAILAATITRLRQAGREGCTVEAVAAQARCAKGLVLYHFRAKDRLLREAGAALAQDRWTRLGHALAAGWDGLWRELLDQQRDGTARAYLDVLQHLESRDPGQAFSNEVGAWLRRSGVSDPEPDASVAARSAVDGVTAALAAGAEPDGLQVAFLSLGLAVLALAEENQA